MTAVETAVTGTDREQTRAWYPDREGYVERDGVRTFYEVYGTGEPTVLLMPTWSIIHSRFWKMQIPYLARHARVVTFDGRGNGRSDRPSEPEAYREEEYAADAVAVLDETSTERAAVVSLSRGAERSLWLAADHPDRVSCATSTTAGGTGIVTTGSRSTRSSGSSSSRNASPSRTRPSSARTRSAGASRRTRRRWSPHSWRLDFRTR